MQGFIDWMNKSFTPKMNKITGNAWVAGIQDAIMGVLPLILVGSLMTLLSLLKMVIPAIPDLDMINNFSFGLMSLFIAFLIPYYVMQRKKVLDKTIVAGTAGAALYLIAIFPKFSADGATVSFTFERFGGVGMFVALIAGLFTAFIMYLFSKFSFFRNNDSLPDFIVVWFDSLLPVTLILLVGWAFTFQWHIDLFTVINAIFKPLTASAQSFWGFVFFSFLGIFFYSFGISAWVLYPVLYGVWVQGIQENANLVAAGHVATNIHTMEVAAGWIDLGGMGATFGLVFMMTFLAKSKRLKLIGGTVLVPTIFNINEPAIFGAPIAFNPVMMVPMWINGIVLPAITWLTMHFGLVTIPDKMNQMWYLPIGVSTYIFNLDWRGLVLMAVNLVISTLIWYPFFRVYDNQLVETEAAKARAKKEKQAAKVAAEKLQGATES
ncbi:PTS sugar transporter subunit IIC [Schleiferilactobacillus perolens]|jgi:PTS system cellobiose-specific IIC component|uniref:PTS sugar transporter subunit IIC n=1 Tax=Schleiferilactobacillus perolens TaxID=100468 RepID=UPI002353E7BD|nr:PTS transporter subunit EIIC [Schleiferilactobacillus perolens]MCI2170039.1 PTS transporter subunit EIIC [Schleiferilactobacillus perolens]